MRLLCALTLLVLPTTIATADVQLFADSGPNSPFTWPSWFSPTKADVVAGTFTNMRTGLHPDTLDADPYDFIAYNTGDLGKVLAWIFWVPGETTASLDGRFEFKWVVDWDGVNWTWDWDFGHYRLDDPNAGWTGPANSSWEDYSGGVIGFFTFGYLAPDNEAPPFDTDNDPFNEADQADIDALRSDVLAHQTFLTGYVRTRASVNDPWEITTLTVNVVPSPSAALLSIVGLGVTGRMRRSI